MPSQIRQHDPHSTGKTLLDKVWDEHVVRSANNEPDLLYVDLHLVHEVSSPQAFEALRLAGRSVRRPDLTLATVDHAVPTTQRRLGIQDALSRKQLETLLSNCEYSKIAVFDLADPRQGIVHVVGPEQGLTQPGMTIVCGDSHTATHGAFGALAFGIGTSEVEHVLATQTLLQNRPKSMSVDVTGVLPLGVTAKDVILGVIQRLGTDGATGHVIEFRGSTIQDLSMEGRMTVCNMSIEAGAKAGLVCPDEKTFAYLDGRPFSPIGSNWESATDAWSQLRTDEKARFDSEFTLDAAALVPYVSWGTNPGQTLPITGVIPSPDDFDDPAERDSALRALEYMGLTPGTPLIDIPVDRVFLGSCTNARIEDLRMAASLIQGKKVAPGVSGIVVPGSGLVKEQAEKEGLDRIFKSAGLEWRDAGCSMCIGMNADVLSRGERCASTSNRNFEGRQGVGGRTHIMSPPMAVAAAVHGRLSDVREWM